MDHVRLWNYWKIKNWFRLSLTIFHQSSSRRSPDQDEMNFLWKVHMFQPPPLWCGMPRMQYFSFFFSCWLEYSIMWSVRRELNSKDFPHFKDTHSLTRMYIDCIMALDNEAVKCKTSGDLEHPHDNISTNEEDTRKARRATTLFFCGKFPRSMEPHFLVSGVSCWWA